MARGPIYLILMAVVFGLLPSCSTKKNTAGTRFYQAFTTRYNVYFNGEEHYKEQIKKMEKEYEDDYSDLVYIHPAEAYADPKAPQPSADFARTIEKMQKAIALHSIQKRPKKDRGKMKNPKYREFLKRGEYNPFLHNAWRLMGEAQYLNGDFLGSAATFMYIEKHFTWLPELVTESKIWQVRCYCAMGWANEAENIVTRVKSDELTNKRLRTMWNTAYADFLIKSKRINEAAPYLENAVKSTGGVQKTRLNFLLGQVYESQGDKARAYKVFGNVAGASSASYRTQFNARIKQSEVFQGSNVESEVKSLKRMARQDRNKDYLDQLYYAIGNLYLSRRDTTNAIENYIIANEKSTRNGIDKAINQITLGGLYFDRYEYDKAQPCYSEGIAQLPDDYPNYAMLKRRSDVLDELAVYSQNVTLQDSLLELSKLSPEEQRKVAERLAEELKEKERKQEEEARKQQYLAEAGANANQLQSNTQTYTLNNDKSWYFYNTATKNAGKTQFQKLWGSRKLEDDWRRINKASFSMSEFEDTNYDDDEQQKEMTDSLGNPLSDEQIAEAKKAEEDLKKEQDPHFPEYYLVQIPKTDEERENANNIIQEGLFNMGIILKDKLEDVNAAANAFNELEERYPDNIYRLDAYYNMYLMYVRYGINDRAEVYRQKILSDFPDSKYGLALADPNYIQNLRDMENVQEKMYEATYEDYLANRNEAVHQSYKEMMDRFPLSKIMPKFMLLDAFAYLPEKKYDDFRETLKELLVRYPETDITPLASSILKDLAKGRKINSGSSNMRGMIWSIRLSNDTTENAGGGTATPFDRSTEGEFVFLLTYPTDSVSSNRLLFEVARHNFSSYTVRDFDIERLSFGRLGIVVIKGFNGLADVEEYSRMLFADKQVFMDSKVRPVFISKKNFDILLNEGRSFDEYFSFINEQSYDSVEQKIEETEKEIEGDTPTAESEGLSVRDAGNGVSQD